MRDYLTTAERGELPASLQAAAKWPDLPELVPLEEWLAKQPEKVRDSLRRNAHNTVGWLASYFAGFPENARPLAHVDTSAARLAPGQREVVFTLRIVLLREETIADRKRRTWVRPWDALITYGISRPLDAGADAFRARLGELLNASMADASGSPLETPDLRPIPKDPRLGVYGKVLPVPGEGFFGRFRWTEGYLRPDYAVLRMEEYVWEEREVAL